MCGILGQFSTKEKLNKNLFLKALNNINHRGPDDFGIEEGYLNEHNFLLGHKRLSIIDLSSKGKQPFQSKDKRFTLIFNGEIYNYLELKKILINKGFSFNSESDTEVLLNAWIYWGTDCLDKLIGMFSFGILDKLKNTLHIVRDGFGIKPLFYFNNIDCSEIFFSSEIEPIRVISDKKNTLNKNKAIEYLFYSLYDHEEETFIKEINSLKQGHFIKFDLNNKTKTITRWWDPNIKEKLDITYEEAKIEVKNQFLKNIELHLRSDVRIASALSGGLDSSAIIACIKYLKPDMDIETFTYSAEDKNINEDYWAKLISDFTGFKNNLVTINKSDFKNDLKELIKSQGEPFGSTSIYAQYCVHRKMKENNFKVVIDGQGGDELLGGYSGYRDEKIRKFIYNGDFNKYFEYLKSLSKNYNLKFEELFKLSLKGILPRNILNKLTLAKNKNKYKWINFNEILEFDKNNINYFSDSTLSKYFNSSNNLTDFLYLSVDYVGLPSLLRHEDRNSMNFSLESRVPFLTNDFAEFMFKLPDEFLVSNTGRTKSIFRDSMKGILPNQIIERKDKLGFETPEFVLVKSLLEDIDQIIDIAKEIPFFNYKNLKNYLQFLTSDKKNFDWIAWRIINLCYWIKINKINI